MFRRKCRTVSLPHISNIRNYADLPDFFVVLDTHFAEQIRELLSRGDEVSRSLHTALTVLRESATPGAMQIGGGTALDAGRILMLNDIYSALTTGKLTEAEAAA